MQIEILGPENIKRALKDEWRAEQNFLVLFLYLIGIFAALHGANYLYSKPILRYSLPLIEGFLLLLHFLPDVRKYVHLGLLLILGDLGAHFFPIPDSNPFLLFSLDKNLYFAQSSVAFFMYLIVAQSFDSRWIERFVKWMPLVFLSFCSAFYSIFNFHSIDPHDGARHISSALTIYNHLVSGRPDKFVEALLYYDFYFPLSYFASFPFFLVFGKSFTAGCLSLSLFWLPLAYHISIKTLTRFFQIDLWQASFATFLVLGTSMSVSLLKNYMQDFPAMVVMLAFQYLVFASDFFKDRRLSFWAGLVFGLGLITKANFFLFGLISVAFGFYRAIGQREVVSFIQNSLLFFFVLSVPAGIWFSVNIYHFAFELTNGVKLYGETNFPPVLSSDSLTWYFPRFLYSFGILQSLLALVGLVLMIVLIRKLSIFWVFSLFSFLFFYTIIHFFRVKDQRTLFPALALLTPLFTLVFRIVKRPWRLAYVAFLLLWIGQENIFYATGKAKVLPSSWLNEPFVVPAGYGLANMEDPNRSHYMLEYLCDKAKVSMPDWNWPGEYTPFFQRYGNQMFDRNPEKFGKPNDKKSEILFCRDAAWPDYYLFSLDRSRPDTLGLWLEASKATVGGDYYARVIFFDAQKQVLKDTTLANVAFPKVLELAKWPGAEEVELSLGVHHSHPSGQKVRAYYQFLDRPYDPFFHALEFYQSGGGKTSAIRIRL